MFGKNEKVGVKYFQNAKPNEMFVTSMFMTLQGEGPYRGMPAFFIRLAKCNLACSFCDTYFDDGDWLTFDQIEDKIEQAISKFYNDQDVYRPGFTFHDKIFSSDPKDPPERIVNKKKMVLVMTGGEPTLQINLGPFLQKMEHIFQYTQIESNGIVFRDLPESTTLVVSPKCLERDGEAIRYMKPNLRTLGRANCLKFVMSADGGPYSDIPDWAHEWADQTEDGELYISPMNMYNSEPKKALEVRAQKNYISLDERSVVNEVISFWEPGLLDMEENQKNHEYAAQFCMTHGYILNLQIHLYASLA